MTATEFFDSVADASRRIAYLDGLCASDVADLSAPRRSGRGAPSRVPSPDAMARVDSAIDRQLAASREASSLRAEVAYGMVVIGGVGRVLGDRVASVVELRYVRLLGWAEIADEARVSRSTAIRLRDMALDTVDALGVARVASGFGIAEN